MAKLTEMMMTRSRALVVVALPIAVLILMGADEARVRAQAVSEQPMASRSGIDLAALDRTVNPCEDFYQFACGGWIGKHPAPPDQPRYGRFNELQDRNNEILKDILANAARPGAAPELQKVGDYYASCMAEPAIEARGRAPLAADLVRVAAIKDKTGI